MCYNVLSDKYATRQMYGYCPTWALAWDYRKKNILAEIRHYTADIISLQVKRSKVVHFWAFLAFILSSEENPNSITHQFYSVYPYINVRISWYSFVCKRRNLTTSCFGLKTRKRRYFMTNELENASYITIYTCLYGLPSVCMYGMGLCIKFLWNASDVSCLNGEEADNKEISSICETENWDYSEILCEIVCFQFPYQLSSLLSTWR